MRCLVCGRHGAKYRNLCKNHYNQVYDDEVRKAERARKAALMAALREARKTMTDGEIADQIIERWRKEEKP